MEQRQTARAIETFRWILALPVEYRSQNRVIVFFGFPWFLSVDDKSIFSVKNIEYLVATCI